MGPRAQCFVAGAALVLGEPWHRNTALSPQTTVSQDNRNGALFFPGFYGPRETLPRFSRQSVPSGLKLMVLMVIGDDDGFPYMGQMNNTSRHTAAEITVLKMVAFETWSILEDQVWIEMKIVQVQPESSHAKDIMQPVRDGGQRDGAGLTQSSLDRAAFLLGAAHHLSARGTLSSI